VTRCVAPWSGRESGKPLVRRRVAQPRPPIGLELSTQTRHGPREQGCRTAQPLWTMIPNGSARQRRLSEQPRPAGTGLRGPPLARAGPPGRAPDQVTLEPSRWLSATGRAIADEDQGRRAARDHA
jgi:hypothetical protein